MARTVRTMMMRTEVEGSFSPPTFTLRFVDAAISSGVMNDSQPMRGMAQAWALPGERPGTDSVPDGHLP